MIFLTFLKLGCYSFGGPAAHLSYFHEEFVRRQQWLKESDLGEIIALTQLLPGPGSSQTGFLIGVVRGGFWGGLQAWLGFTLPSAVLLISLAAGVNLLQDSLAEAAMRGLQL
ncbi:MAG: chromate transporter, partial [Bryobacteraceae bacterium]